MSVKLIDNEAFYGYRVRRTIEGKLFQEYYSLKKAGKRMTAKLKKAVENEAKARDEQLAEQQKKAKQRSKADRCFTDKGEVKGISFLKKKEKSGNVTPIFQVGIASELEGKIVCTSFSLNAHGVDEAWQKAVEAYCEHKQIKKGTKLYKQILAAMPKVDAASKRKAETKKKAAAKKKPAAKKAVAKKKALAKKKAVAKKKPVAKKAVAKKKAPAKKKVAAKKKPAAKKAVAKKKAPAKKKAAAKKKPAAKKK